MPRFQVRLEDPQSEHFRIVNVSASTKEEAKVLCEQREDRIVAATYDDEALAKADAEYSPEKAARGLRPGLRVVHEQTEPYRVVSVTKRGEGKSKTKAKRKPKRKR